METDTLEELIDAILTLREMFSDEMVDTLEDFANVGYECLTADAAASPPEADTDT